MPERIDHPRRNFLRILALGAALAPLGAIGRARAQTSPSPAAPAGGAGQGAQTSFAPLKRITAGVLEVGYAEAGPADGPPVLLLHGWPYDIHSYVNVAPILAGAGYRVIVPYLRGYGTTRFLSDGTPRNGQQAALGRDLIALMDALKIKQAVIAGYDWGARTANIVAALWPERCKALVSVSGYLIGSQEANKAPLPPKAELQWWYQYYFATERGQEGYAKYTRDFARLSGNWPRRNGPLTTRPSRARPQPSTTPTMSPSPSIITAGGSDSPPASRNMMNSRSGSLRFRRSTCRRSRSKAMPMARRIPSPLPMRSASPADTSTGSSPAASAIIRRRRRRGPSPRR